MRDVFYAWGYDVIVLKFLPHTAYYTQSRDGLIFSMLYNRYESLRQIVLTLIIRERDVLIACFTFLTQAAPSGLLNPFLIGPIFAACFLGPQDTRWRIKLSLGAKK